VTLRTAGAAETRAGSRSFAGADARAVGDRFPGKRVGAREMGKNDRGPRGSASTLVLPSGAKADLRRWN